MQNYSGHYATGYENITEQIALNVHQLILRLRNIKKEYSQGSQVIALSSGSCLTITFHVEKLVNTDFSIHLMNIQRTSYIHKINLTIKV